ncbi:hypothetical protein [uncultured Clostridium sp.]|uniref:hypothetical protein n=1 Tax=uncultured Clostridium sp. TaxID=59620 RepID=UPI00261F88FE|nr:hypothetical protein [uncultured Clostridium sp.]
MANFEFRKKVINLKICNKTYQIEDDKNLVKKLISFGEEMQVKADSINSENNTYEYYEKVTTELSKECYKFINDLLGAGSSAEIFKNNMYNIEDCFSLLDFIKTEIGIQKEQRVNKYSNKRIQREQNFKKRR